MVVSIPEMACRNENPWKEFNSSVDCGRITSESLFSERNPGLTGLSKRRIYWLMEVGGFRGLNGQFDLKEKFREIIYYIEERKAICISKSKIN